MAILQFHDDSGTPIDARFEARAKEMMLHSCEGVIGSPDARNTRYGLALRLLLERIARSRLTLDGIWVDSTRARKLPIEQRRVHFPSDAEASPDRLFTSLSERIASVARDPGTRKGRDNWTRKLRIAFAGEPSDEEIVRVAGYREHPSCGDAWRSTPRHCAGSRSRAEAQDSRTTAPALCLRLVPGPPGSLVRGTQGLLLASH